MGSWLIAPLLECSVAGALEISSGCVSLISSIGASGWDEGSASSAGPFSAKSNGNRQLRTNEILKIQVPGSEPTTVSSELYEVGLDTS